MVEVYEVLQWLQLVVFVGLGVAAGVHWRRQKGAPAAWLTATFWCLGAVLVVGRFLGDDAAETHPVLIKALLIVLGLFPYCLFRFMTAIAPPRRWLAHVGDALTAGLIVFTLFLPKFPPPGEEPTGIIRVWLIVFVIHWAVLSLAVGWRLWRAGRGQPPVARRRMRTLSLAAVGLTITLVVSSFTSDSDPNRVTTTELVTGFLSLLSAPLFLFGFAPPAWLRTIWRRKSEEDVAAAEASLIGTTTAKDVTDVLLPPVARLFGGTGAAVIDAGGDLRAWYGDAEQLAATASAIAARGDTPRENTVAVPLQDGWLVVQSSPFTPFFGADETTRLARLASSAELALGRIAAQDALRASQARLGELVEIAPDAVISVDADQRIVMFNKGAESIFGWSSEEIVGRPLDELLPRAVRDEHRSHIEGFARDQIHARTMGHRGSVYGLRRDGTEFPAEASISKLDHGGELTFTVILRDITERRQSEAQLAARTEELARSNAELEQFAYVASHDLQEPLRKVASFCQLLARKYEGQLDERADQYIHFAVDGATRMQLLINDLLDYSRVGRADTAFELVDCNVALGRALSNLETAIDETGATVSAEPLPTVVGIPLRITQVFQNLIANALKFRSAEPPVVRIGAERVGDEWEFSVADNGIGIEPQYADRIFVVFQRLHTKEAYPGTGIGLAICKKIVERHGGRIWLESTPGVGSTFRWTMPVDVVTNGTAAQPEAIAPAKEEQRT